MSQSGRLELILGSMFAGKSTELLRRVGRLTAVGKQVLVVSYTGDTRSDHSISTHDGQSTKHTSVKYPACHCTLISEVFSSRFFDACDVIAVDEGQFFEDIYDTVITLVTEHKKFVIIAGLDGNFRRECFGDVLRLLPLADDYCKLHALCMICASEKRSTLASFTLRLNEEDGEFLIGGSNEYMAVCRECYETQNK